MMTWHLAEMFKEMFDQSQEKNAIQCAGILIQNTSHCPTLARYHDKCQNKGYCEIFSGLDKIQIFMSETKKCLIFY